MEIRCKGNFQVSGNGEPNLPGGALSGSFMRRLPSPGERVFRRRGRPPVVVCLLVIVLYAAWYGYCEAAGYGRAKFPHPPVMFSRHGLCYDKPEDTEQYFPAELRNGGRLPDKGEPFSDELQAKFPYAGHGHCDKLQEEPLQLATRGCHLMGFAPDRFLRIIRGRKLVFWGDSVTRQFFTYLQLRLDAYALPSAGTFAGKSSSLGRADPKRCILHTFMNDRGLRLSEACFKLPPADWDEDRACVYFHGHDVGTAICYVRAEHIVVDDRNVVFLNAMTEHDILFMNIGLHHNHVRTLRESLGSFASLLHHLAQRRTLPLMLWRETTAQHFNGGQGGNFPTLLAEELRNIDPESFKCTKHRYRTMARTNWRNDLLRDWGFQHESTDGPIEIKIPFLATWNVTAMAHDHHPRVLSLDSGGNATTVADCTHFCPYFGGIYEVLSTLLFNGLHALQPFGKNLRPKLVDSPAYRDPELLRVMGLSFKLSRTMKKEASLMGNASRHR